MFHVEISHIDLCFREAMFRFRNEEYMCLFEPGDMSIRYLGSNQIQYLVDFFT